MHPSITIRHGGASDLAFMRWMMVEAYHWNHHGPLPDVDDYLDSHTPNNRMDVWRTGTHDCCAIAEVNNEPVGAAWYRFATDASHSYGYVNPQTPELGIGIRREFRRQGIGRRLMRSLIETARNDGHPAISLSVAPHNPARKLYESLGFKRVGESGTSWTYLLTL
jgi:ribosomal protein S18 acetylase RimI-like enzyme